MTATFIDILSGALGVLFLLLFIRSGTSVARFVLSKIDMARISTIASHPSITSWMRFPKNLKLIWNSCNTFVQKRFGTAGVASLLSALLTASISILTSCVFFGVIAATVVTGSFATFLEFYIVYVMLQLPFVFCAVAFEGAAVDTLILPFIEVFWTVHKRTLSYFLSIGRAQPHSIVAGGLSEMR